MFFLVLPLNCATYHKLINKFEKSPLKITIWWTKMGYWWSENSGVAERKTGCGGVKNGGGGGNVFSSKNAPPKWKVSKRAAKCISCHNRSRPSLPRLTCIACLDRIYRVSCGPAIFKTYKTATSQIGAAVYTRTVADELIETADAKGGKYFAATNKLKRVFEPSKTRARRHGK